MTGLGRRRTSARLGVLAAALVALTGCGVHSVAGTIKPLGDLPPIQDPAYFQTTEMVQLDNGLVDGIKTVDDGQLKGPHFNLRMGAVAVTDSLDSTQAAALSLGDGDGVRAARKHEFVLVEFDTDSNSPPPWDPSTAPPTAVISVGDQQIPFTLPGSWDESIASFMVPFTVVAISVPVGTDPLLQVTDDKVTQTLNLRTGERGDDAVPLYYAPRHQDLDLPAYDAAGVVTTPANGVPVSRPYTVSFTMGDDVSGDLSPWVPDSGWAQPGRAWLGFGGFTVDSDGYTFDAAQFQPLLRFSLDFATTFTLTMPDGTKVQAQPGTIADVELDSLTSMTTIGFNGYEARFNVPSDFDTGTVSVLPAGNLVASYTEGDFPAAWTQPSAPLDVPIDLGP